MQLVVDVAMGKARRVEGDDLLDSALVDRPTPGAAGRAVARELRGEILHLARLLQGHEPSGDAQLDFANLLGVDAPVEQAR